MTSMNAIAHSAVAKEFTYVRDFLGVSTFNQDGSYAGTTVRDELDAIWGKIATLEAAVQIETTAG